MTKLRLVSAGIAVMSALAFASCGDDGPAVDAPMGDSPPVTTAMLSIDRADVPFGSATVGQPGTMATVTITNTGTADTGVVSATLSGADSTSFTATTNTCTTTLAPGGSCAVAIQFLPGSSGDKTATLDVTATPGGDVSATLSGTGLAPGALSISGSPAILGSAEIGRLSATTATFTVTNTGTGTTTPLSLTADGADPADFAVATDLCSNETLAPAASCTFMVSFTPLSAGPKSASFVVRAGLSGAVVAAVSGTGLGHSHLVAVPTSVDFGSVVVGQPSGSRTITLANAGGVTTGPIVYGFVGTNAGAFEAASSDCPGATLAPGATCSFVVRVTPPSTGEQHADFRVSTTPGDTATVPVSAIGIVSTQLTVAPSTKAFAPTPVGQTSASQTFTITNGAAVASGPLSSSISGAGAAQFRIIASSDTCNGQSLTAAATCTITISYAPTVGGEANATLTIASANAGTATAGLSGVGLADAHLVIAPDPHDYGSVTVGSQSAEQVFTITNTGGQPSGAPSTMLGGAGAAQFVIGSNTCTSALAPFASCTVAVRFVPSATGAVMASLTVAGTPGGAAIAVLRGTGAAAGELVFVPSSFTFAGATSIGDSRTQQFTLINEGSATAGPITIATSGPAATDYVVSTTCSSLAPNASCPVTVTFTPSAVGARDALLTAASTVGGSPTAGLSGTGVPRLEVVALDGGPVVDPYNFGSVTTNSTAPHDLLVTVRNNTSSPKPLSLDGAFGAPAQFAVIANSCASDNMILATDTCVVRVRFTPTTMGAHAGTLTFAIGATALDQAVQHFTGNGIDGLSIVALAGTSFGSVTRGQTSEPLAFRVSNLAGAVTTGAITTALSPAGGFAISDDDCVGETLPGGGSCVIEVTFTPTVMGAASTTLSATASPGGSPSIAITATGVDPTGTAPTALSLSPTTVAETAPVGTTVGTFTTTDADAGDTFTYALVGGAGSADNAAFAISGSTLVTAATFDFELKSAYTVRVRVTDSGGNALAQAFAITVTDVDEAPVAVADSFSVAEDTASASLDVLANDTDVDAGPKRVTAITQPAHGTAMIAAGGTAVLYTPAANYNGPDSVAYTLNGGSVTTVSITVTPVDDAPVAVADALTVIEDAPAAAVAVLANDTDVDGGPKTIASVTQGTNGGVVVITGGGTGLTYQPGLDRTGTDTFTYTLNGGSTATVTVTITAVDDPPVAVADSFPAIEDTATDLTPLTNDTDVDGGPISITSITQPSHGTATLNGTLIHYMPALNYNGPDSLTYTLNGGSTATISISVAPVDDGTVLAVGSTITYTENDAAKVIDSGITVTDGDSMDLTGATIQITTGLASAEDELAFTAGNGITGSYAAGTGKLTLSGTSTLANYQAALRSVTYHNSSENPTTTTRIVSFIAFDGTTPSNTLTSTVNVVAVNDPPVLATPAVTLAYTENGAAAVVDALITATDADSTNLTGATVQITGNYQSGADVLAFTTAAGISGTFNSMSGTLTLTGSATVANYQAALRAVTYVNTSENPSTLQRTVSFTATDGDASNTVTSKIDVTAVNDAPALSPLTGTLTFTEGDAATVIQPALMATDVDSTNLTGATITLSNYVNGQDFLAFTAGNGIGGVFSAGTGTLTLGGTATVAQYQAALRTVTYNNTSQTPSTTARTASFTVTDGSLTSNVASVTITVISVDSAPVVTTTATTLAYTENAAATPIDTGVLVTDTDDTNLEGGTVSISGGFAEDVLALSGSHTVTATYSAGVLTLAGTATVAEYQAVLRDVTYRNTSEDPSTTARTVTFVVTDGEKTSTPATRTIAITAVDDPTVLASTQTPVTYTENGAAVAIDTTLAVSDVDTTTLSTATITVTTGAEATDMLDFTNQNGITGSFNSTTHVLTLSGSSSLANYQTALRSIAFRSTSENPGTTQRSVTFTVGAAGTSNTVTAKVNVVAVNDAPVLTGLNSTLAYTENQSATPISSTVSVSDADDTNLTGATVAITMNYAAGQDELGFTTLGTITGNVVGNTLTLSGTATVAQYQAALATVTYRNSSDDPSTLPRTVSFTVDDGHAANHASNTVTRGITVTAVNDAPVLANSTTVGYTENGAGVAIDPIITASDADSANLTGATITIAMNFEGTDVLGFTNTATITSLYNNGTLTLMGSDTVANYQAALRAVTYRSTSENPGTGQRQVTFTATDGTTPSNTVTSLVTVTAVNDAPALAGTSTITYTEGDGPVVVNSGITATDVDSVNLTAAVVAIGTNYVNGEDVLALPAQPGLTSSFNTATGTLTISGTTTVAAYQTALRAVTYSNASNAPSTMTRTITFQVTDGALQSNSVNSTVMVVSVNSAPQLIPTSTNLTYPRGSGAVAINTMLVANDADDANLEGATISITSGFVAAQDTLGFTNQNGISGSYNAATGVLTLTGTATKAFYSNALHAVTYTNSSATPTMSRTISFTVTDGEANSNTATTAITITNPPAASPDSIQTERNVQLCTLAACPAAVQLTSSFSVLTNDSLGDGGTMKTVTQVQGSSDLTTFHATANAGSVKLNADGTFTFIPKAGDTAASDSFSYTFSDGVGTATSTVTVSLVGPRVWFVKNNAAAGGTGVSTSPFNTLVAAQTVAVANDTVFVFVGDGTTAGQTAGFAFGANGQQLIGEFEGLTTKTTINGVTDATIVSPSAAKPKITNASASTIRGTSLQSLVVAGLDLSSTASNGVAMQSVAGIDLHDLKVANCATDGIQIMDPTGAIGITSNTVTGSGRDNVRISTTSGASTLVMSGTYSSVNATTGHASIYLDVGGTATMTSATLGSATVASNGAARGVWVNASGSATVGPFTIQSTTFDSNGIHVAIDQAGTATVTFKVVGLAIMTNAKGNAINVFSAANSTGGRINGTIQNVNIGSPMVPKSGSATGSGIGITVQGKTVGAFLIDGNKVYEAPIGRGIDAEFLGSTVSAMTVPESGITITNNVVDHTDATVHGDADFPLAAIFVAADNQGSPANVNAIINGNTAPAGMAFDYDVGFIEYYVFDPAADAGLKAPTTNTGSYTQSAEVVAFTGTVVAPPP